MQIYPAEMIVGLLIRWGALLKVLAAVVVLQWIQLY